MNIWTCWLPLYKRRHSLQTFRFPSHPLARLIPRWTHFRPWEQNYNLPEAPVGSYSSSSRASCGAMPRTGGHWKTCGNSPPCSDCWVWYLASNGVGCRLNPPLGLALTIGKNCTVNEMLLARKRHPLNRLVSTCPLPKYDTWRNQPSYPKLWTLLTTLFVAGIESSFERNVGEPPN